MELVREYLIISFLFRQKRKKSESPQSFIGRFGSKADEIEYSPQMVRQTIYRYFGKGEPHSGEK